MQIYRFSRSRMNERGATAVLKELYADIGVNKKALLRTLQAIIMTVALIQPLET